MSFSAGQYILKKMDAKIRKKNIVLSLFFTSLLSFLLFPLNIIYKVSLDSFIILASSIGLFISIAASLMAYLQVDKKKYEQNLTENIVYEKISGDDLKKISEALEERFVQNKSDGIIWSIYRNTEQKLEQFSESSIAGKVFEQTRQRLGEQIFSLQRRGNLNLVLGITITIIGLIILWYYVLFQGFSSHNEEEFLAFFVPRLSLVILIETFAYFFLRLYKASITDIKFFQNELTNIEAKLTAMQLTFPGKNPEERLCILTHLIRTERNPVKVQKATIEAGTNHMDSASLIDLIKTISDVLIKKQDEDKK